MAIAGILASPLSGCGTRALDVQLEDLSKDTCMFEGLMISTSGFASDVSEALITEEIITKPSLCTDPNNAAGILSMDAKYYKCLDKFVGVNEKTKVNFKLISKPENKQPYTSASHVFTISERGMDNFHSARHEYIKSFTGKIKVDGKIINQKGVCLLYAKKITKTE